MTTAIILDAGDGSSSTTQPEKTCHEDFGKMPRALINLSQVNLGEETILERQIRLLNKNGITDIIVVVGWEKEQIINKYPNLNYVICNDWSEVGDEYYGEINSLMQTKYLWDDKDDILVIIGDIVFEERALIETLELSYHLSGFIFIGSTQQGRYEQGEIFFMRMNKKGMNYLKSLSLKEKILVAENMIHTVPYNRGGVYHYIFQSFHITSFLSHLKTLFEIDKIDVFGYILDIDWKKDFIKIKNAGII